MKTLFRYATLLFVSANVMLSSCNKKSDDPTPAPTPTCDGGSVKTKSVVIDNSTSTSTYTKSYEQNVTKCDGSATIVLDVKSMKDMDKIYIVKSEDNSQSNPVYLSDVKGTLPGTDTYDKTFAAGGISKGYSLDIPDGLSSTKYIQVPLSVPVRNSDAAVTDVYTIWITNGNGDFTANGKRTIIGPITVTLRYQGVASSATYISGTATLGDQTATPPSYLTTSGQIGTFSGTALIESGMSTDEKANTLNSADVNFVGLSSDGSIIGNGQTPHFISVGIRSSVGFTGNTEGTNQTKFGLYTGSIAFENMTASDISGLSSPTAGKIQVSNNTTYVFLTSDGRKGVIRTSNLSTNTTGKTVDVKVKALIK